MDLMHLLHAANEFEHLALTELDWEGSRAHWQIRLICDDIVDGKINSMDEAMDQFRSYLNDTEWGAISEEEMLEMERGESDEDRLDRWNQEREERNPLNRWQQICKVA